MFIPDDFNRACYEGNLEEVKEVAKERKIQFDNYNIRYGLKAASKNNHAHVVKYIFNERRKGYHSEEYLMDRAQEENTTIEAIANNYIRSYVLDVFREVYNDICIKGNLEIFKLYMDILEKFPTNHDFEVCMQYACSKGHLEMVQYMLTVPGADDYIHQQKFYNKVLVPYTSDGNAVTQYFLETPALCEKVKVLKLLGKAYAGDNGALIDYIILEHDLAYSNKVRKVVSDMVSGVRNIPELFEIRENVIKFAETLENDLPKQEKPVSRIKI